MGNTGSSQASARKKAGRSSLVISWGETSGAKKGIFITQLRAKYKQLYDAVQPIPYIRDRLYCVDRVYVEGGIQYFAASWLPLDSYHSVLHNQQIKAKRRIITGAPGYGKSTLTLQYAYDWCNRVEESSLKNVEILIILRLRQLGGVRSVYKAIKQFILPQESELNETDIETVLQESSSVLVILDGFDEYPDDDNFPKTDIMKIILSQMFAQFDVILTTRYLPKQYPPNTKLLRLTGFDDRARDEYIRKAVVGDDVLAASKIKQRLHANPVLGDLCQVPLFFVMFAHMSHEDEEFQTFKTVTSFFQFMIKCFHSHMRNKMEDTNVQVCDLHEANHLELDKVAFEGLSKRSQQIVWKRDELRARLGQEFYDQYIRIGILVEEDVISGLTLFGNSHFNKQKTEGRFYHKLFCEWYAAYRLGMCAIAYNPDKLKNVLKHMNPFDLQYCYRFACGLNQTLAGNIIECVKRKNGGDKFAILCILEQGGRVEDILDIVKDLCSEQIDFSVEDSKLLQRSTIQILEIASKLNISISCVNLKNCCSIVDLRGGNYLQLNSNLSIPVLTTINKLTIVEEAREITSEEFTGILQYSSKCLALDELWFEWCLLPPSVKDESVSVLRSRNVKVRWLDINYAWYCLDLASGRWKNGFDGRRGEMTDRDYHSVMDKIFQQCNQDGKSSRTKQSNE